jgi:hypothetical protein
MPKILDVLRKKRQARKPAALVLSSLICFLVNEFHLNDVHIWRRPKVWFQRCCREI